MLWWIGLGLIFVWLLLFIFHPSGWIHLLLLGGITVLVIQTAAYRKTKYTLKNRQ